MLHPIADGVCLEELGSIDQGGKAHGIAVGLLQVIHDLAVCPVVPLVLLHDVGENILIPWVIGKGINGLLTGKCLEAELGSIAEEELPVL